MAAPEQRARRTRRAAGGRVIAITGVHGSLARRLLRRLDDDSRVARLVLIDRTNVVAPLLKAAFYRLDLTEPNADGHIAEILHREGADALVHLAFTRQPLADPALAHELESVGTMHIVSAVAQAGGAGRPLRQLLVVTTGLVYGARPDGPAIVSEADPLRGCPGYSFIEEKVEAERQLEAARSRLPVPVTVLRPSLTLSPGDDSVFAAYLSRAVVPTIWGHDPLVQLVHEEDVVEACRIAIARRPNAAYNIAGTGPLPLGTLIRLAGCVELPLLGCAAPSALDALYRFGLCPLSGGHTPFLRYSLVLDGQHAMRDLGFRPRRSTAEVLEHFLGRRLPLAA
jgi:UDP-glucose 4-epimerase